MFQFQGNINQDMLSLINEAFNQSRKLMSWSAETFKAMSY